MPPSAWESVSLRSLGAALVWRQQEPTTKFNAQWKEINISGIAAPVADPFCRRGGVEPTRAVCRTLRVQEVMEENGPTDGSGDDAAGKVKKNTIRESESALEETRPFAQSTLEKRKDGSALGKSVASSSS